ncbi:ATP synthase F1 subcomplex gamma subunit [Dongia mobilis]|uniref:ATP synthase gamma chain n=1 Tax=Dongia mobilis TaxID=578943 RepID=A0A4R6WSZ1_9PROT|nr:F0F1 ATP synthase subunit gamma [Dongia mobilis]TDQ86329.1 ATP synthase F1 subcomplex gamma subunit [Dongia mobilis]
MPSLKDLKVRINSTKNTQKITSAMKMVSAAKLRRAQEQAEAARPYAERMEKVLRSLAVSMAGKDNAPALLAGTGRDQVHLLVVMTSDRGLCGAFNSSITRQARKMARDLKANGKQVKILAVGRKARDQMKREFLNEIIATIEDVGKPRLTFDSAAKIAQRISHMFEAGEFDVCTVVYNKFKSAITQIVTPQQLIPFALSSANENADANAAIYEYEPDEEAILADLLPRNLSMQVYRALLENAASEQGARMTAMDNATRNAGDMINKLTINYNRTRQANITKELIEIISGAEAV